MKLVPTAPSDVTPSWDLVSGPKKAHKQELGISHINPLIMKPIKVGISP